MKLLNDMKVLSSSVYRMHIESTSGRESEMLKYKGLEAYQVCACHFAIALPLSLECFCVQQLNVCLVQGSLDIKSYGLFKTQQHQ